LYDSSVAPTCSSNAGYLESYAIPPAASAGLIGGREVNLGPVGKQFQNGIAFCVTGGSSSTDNTNATTGGEIHIGYH
jgi:hypothetical protein